MIPSEKTAPRNLVLWAVGACLSIWLLVKLKNVLSLFLLSVLFAYAIHPFVSLVEKLKIAPKKRLSRRVSVFSVVLFFAVLIGILGLVTIPRLAAEIASFASSFPDYALKLRELVFQVAPRVLERNLPPSLVSPIEKEISGAIASLGSFVAKQVYSFVSTILQILSLLIIPTMSIYLLIDGKNLEEGFISRFSGERREKLEELLKRLNTALSSYVRGQALVCLTTGVLCGAIFLAIGLPYSLLLGVTAGLMEAVPIVGFLVTLSLVVLAGLSSSPGLAVLAGVIYVLTNQIVGLVLTPRVMGRQMKLHPFIILISIMCGIQLAGFVGALLSLPVAASARVLLDFFLSPKGRCRDEQERRY